MPPSNVGNVDDDYVGSSNIVVDDGGVDVGSVDDCGVDDGSVDDGSVDDEDVDDGNVDDGNDDGDEGYKLGQSNHDWTNYSFMEAVEYKLAKSNHDSTNTLFMKAVKYNLENPIMIQPNFTQGSS